MSLLEKPSSSAPRKSIHGLAVPDRTQLERAKEREKVGAVKKRVGAARSGGLGRVSRWLVEAMSLLRLGQPEPAPGPARAQRAGPQSEADPFLDYLARLQSDR